MGGDIDTIGACNACGRSLSDAEGLLGLEAAHVARFHNLMDSLSAQNQLQGPGPLDDILKGALSAGLAPEHWIICRVHDILCLVHRKQGRLELASKHASAMLALKEPQLGHANERYALDRESAADD